MVSGWVGLVSAVAGGERQICGLQLPGDSMGFATFGGAPGSGVLPVALTRAQALSCEEIEAAVIAGHARSGAQPKLGRLQPARGA